MIALLSMQVMVNLANTPRLRLGFCCVCPNTMNRQPPKKNETWQHFEHRDGADIFCGEYHRYQIWDVTEAEPQHPQAELQPFSVQHVETGQFHNVFECDSKWWVEGLSEPHVLYTVNFCTHTVWCRALASFMATDDRSPNGFKFWKIASAA